MPDFAIIGAAKCGTTALYSYLATHPNISMSARKEPYYWCPDIRIPAPLTDPRDYACLWTNAPIGALKGEATPAYIRSAVAVRAMLEANPSIRFILILRSPAEMAASFHSEMVFSFQEDVGSFERAWHLQEHRRHGRRIPKTCFHPPDLQYAQVCALGEQLERFGRMVPEEQRLVLLHDDLVADSRAAYLRVLRFLGVADDGRASFEPVHRNRRRRAACLMHLRLALPRSLGPVSPPMRALAARFGINPSELLGRLTTREGPRAPLDPGFQAQLLSAFRPQVEKIEAMLGWDLQDWKAPREAAKG